MSEGTMMPLGEALLGALDGDGDGTPLLEQITAALSVSSSSALVRAAALYVWKRTWERALPASRHGGDRKSAGYRERDQAEKISFCSVAAGTLGIGERAIQLDVQLAERLGAAGIKTLWHSPIADNAAALKTVAAMDEVNRALLYQTWAAAPELSFRAVLVKAQLRAEDDADEALFLRIVEGFTRANSKVRRRFLAEIGLGEADTDRLLRRWQKRGAP